MLPDYATCAVRKLKNLNVSQYNSGGHAVCQDYVAANLRKYYPDPDSLPHSTWDIIERFWNLNLSFDAGLLLVKEFACTLGFDKLLKAEFKTAVGSFFLP